MSSLNSEASAKSGDQTSGALFNLFWTQEYCFAIKTALKSYTIHYTEFTNCTRRCVGCILCRLSGGHLPPTPLPGKHDTKAC